MPPLFNFSRYGGCNFEQKVAAATAANYSAAIVFNLNSDRLLPMGGDGNDTVAPSVFIGYSDAADIMEKYLEPKSRVRRNVFAFEKNGFGEFFFLAAFLCQTMTHAACF